MGTEKMVAVPINTLIGSHVWHEYKATAVLNRGVYLWDRKLVVKLLYGRPDFVFTISAKFV